MRRRPKNKKARTYYKKKPIHKKIKNVLAKNVDAKGRKLLSCPNCGGIGIVGRDGEGMTCLTCQGKGRIHSGRSSILAKLFNSRFKKYVRKYLLDRDGNNCVWCGCGISDSPSDTEMEFATIEHLKEVRNGGTNHMHNLALACGKCNNGRRDQQVLNYPEQ